ncbi:PadR family transcriptional regulator [Peribacillus sp. FSL H8-0477]|uniref:PadR family transcriptional regulator n=1 Tax=Peribacillus sp. FSL H8-0477 TaxID=2921388 RepID=UPI0030F7EE74
MRKKAENYLPLTHTTFYILISLQDPLQGYGIMQRVKEMSDGEVTLGPGTLYGALSKLEKDGLIVKQESDRRKSYSLSELGRMVVTLEYERLKNVVKKCAVYIEELQTSAHKSV